MTSAISDKTALLQLLRDYAANNPDDVAELREAVGPMKKRLTTRCMRCKKSFKQVQCSVVTVNGTERTVKGNRKHLVTGFICDPCLMLFRSGYIWQYTAKRAKGRNFFLESEK